MNSIAALLVNLLAEAVPFHFLDLFGTKMHVLERQKILSTDQQYHGLFVNLVDIIQRIYHLLNSRIWGTITPR